MRNPSGPQDILQTGGFSLHYYVGCLFKVGFLGQSCIIAVLVALVMLTGSLLDHSLILNEPNIGLLQHPALWGFPLLQIALPLVIRQSVHKLQRARLHTGEIAKVEKQSSLLSGTQIRRFLSWQDKESKLAATLIYCTGLAAFIWNTYQNQKPGIVVPYNFWDSKTYFWGFWITRAYKLYLYGWLLPYIAMIQVAILVVTLRLVRRARLSGKLKLFPFHHDGAGGLGFVASIISTPIIATLIVGSLSITVAFLVHRTADVTPLMGLIILIIWTVTAYFIPTLFLRSDIVAMKREVLEKLRTLQQKNYSRIIESHGVDLETLSKGKEALDYYDNVWEKIQKIPNYPHLKRLVRALGFAVTTTTISVALKLMDLVPVVGRLLKKN
ncbi:MAG: hypothetical protein QOH25_1796 [Acidobacteriota bacterium]|jgi:hypothetical protein|nr:hypothetical protein [Acidobacteriota bacterium]